jgi:hypothetical protein
MLTDERTSAISQKLGLAPGTVHTYKERLFRKIGVHSCAQLIAATFAAYVELTCDERYAHQEHVVSTTNLSGVAERRAADLR